MRAPGEPVRATFRRRRHRGGLPTTAVLGAGHGGMALAAFLAARGVPVRLWNRSEAPLRAVAAGGIALHRAGAEPAVARPERVSTDLGEILRGSEAVVVALPAAAHRPVALAAAPHLRDGQAVLLLPGRTGGALEFARSLAEAGCRARVLVGEAATFPLASRVPRPGRAEIHGVKRDVRAAALPAWRTPELLALMRPLLPMLRPAPSVLHTSFDNVGAVLHPAITLLNAGRIEAHPGGFRFYAEGVTPAVARVLAALDGERLAAAAAYGVQARPLSRWLAETYGHRAAGLGEAVAGNPAYARIAAPGTLDHRYLWEDVPTGLVPLAELARAAGGSLPTAEGLIDLAGAVHGVDYRASGRTLERLGLAGMAPGEIVEYVREGGTPGCATA